MMLQPTFNFKNQDLTEKEQVNRCKPPIDITSPKYLQSIEPYALDITVLN